MPRLLVSVRSPAEARDAIAGGAAILDIKEPASGPLGRAEPAVWRAIQQAMPQEIAISVALGELSEWNRQSIHDYDGSLKSSHAIVRSDFDGISYRKLGLAGVGSDWRQEWAGLRRRWSPGPPWIAVIYSDWERAGAPRPIDVVEEALAVEECTGILVDTWDKSQSSTVDAAWLPWLSRIRRQGLTIALAGGLDESRIERLAPLRPDWIAVRGAACHDGDRDGTIDPDRVARLVRLIQEQQQTKSCDPD